MGGLVVAGKQAISNTHTLALRGGIVWCWVCGASATVCGRRSHACMLPKPCRQFPSVACAASLTRLRQGLPPVGAKSWPLAFEDDYKWRAQLLGGVAVQQSPLVLGVGAVPSQASTPPGILLSSAHGFGGGAQP